MAGYKSKNKNVIQKERPKSCHVAQTQNPDSYYKEHPAWCFSSCDTELWGFTVEAVGDTFWTEILPFLKGMESRTWGDILVSAKKQNHSIDPGLLSARAQRRLSDRYIELDSIVSLRISATHRLYGYPVGNVFNILWYDANHGDNESCVCRSKKKHT